MRERSLRVAGLAVACVLAFSLEANAQAEGDWQPRLQSPGDGDFWSQAAALRFHIPADVPIEVLQTLSLEVDDIDVTSLVQREGEFAVYQPPQPLSFGQHRVRLVEYAADGSILERGFWQIEVRKSAAFREAALQANATLDVTRRTADKGLTNPPRKSQGNGSLNLEGQLADGDWRAAMQLPLLYSSQSEPREVDIGNFRFDWQRKGVSALVGHHPVGPDSLVMSGFDRRGISLGYTNPDSGAQVGAFAVHGNSITGFQQGLGVGNEENRVQGVLARFYPVRKQDRSLQVSAVYLDGKSPEAGADAVGSDDSTGGDAWSLAADGLMLENRLRLRGEYAGTHYDFDGDGGSGAESDKAFSLLAVYKPWLQKQVAGEYLDWSYGAEFRRIGTFFRSAASPGSTADRQLTRLFSDLLWGPLQLQGQLAQETDNVNDIATIPRLRTRLGAISASYNPMPEYDEQGQPIVGWLGQQSYTASASRQLQRTVKGATASDFTDTGTNALGVSGNFTYDRWSWGMSYNWTRVHDGSVTGAAPTTNETQTHSTGLNASVTLGENYTLSPHLSWDVTKHYDLGYTDRGLNSGIALDVQFIPGKFTGSLGYDMNHNYLSDDSSNTYDEQVRLNLTWYAIPAREQRPGLTLSLDGNYGNSEDRVMAGNDSTSYQVFLKAAIGWSGGY